MTAVNPDKAIQTVTSEGLLVRPGIEGVSIRQSVTHQDERGTLCEIYSESWAFDDIPMVHAYVVSIRRGKVKGWAVHHSQVDRYFFFSGSIKLVLYDDRPQSSTRGRVVEYHFSEFNRSLVSVPPGVYHAVENIGETEALMFNIPSQAYNYENPDKYTLPIENALIPYSFDRPRGA